MNKHGCISLGSDVTPGLWEDLGERGETPWEVEPDKVFPFLQLSAELRNAVYDFILAEDARHSAVLYHSPKSRREFTSRHPNRKFFGLTQANRLMRSEFYPLYKAHTRVFVQFHHLDQYLQTFPLEDSLLSDEISSTIPSIRKLSDLNEVKRIDITPLVKLDWNQLPFSIAWPAAMGPMRFLYDFLIVDRLSHEWKAHFEDGVFKKLYITRNFGEASFDEDLNILTILVGPKFNEQTDTTNEQIMEKFTNACLRHQTHKTMVRVGGIDYNGTSWNRSRRVRRRAVNAHGPDPEWEVQEN